jgi:hypothetical protein
LIDPRRTVWTQSLTLLLGLGWRFLTFFLYQPDPAVMAGSTGIDQRITPHFTQRLFRQDSIKLTGFS